jgi:glycosyltransferase involved in cell wall biosynthesis
MRVGIDARELAGPSAGVGRYLAELVARWSRDPALAGHELLLFAPTAIPTLRELAGRGGASVTAIVVPGAGGTWWEQGALATAARHHRPNVFFAPGYTAPLRLRVPLVVAMHDVSFAAHPEWFRWREGLRLRWLARRSARAAGRVLTLTACSREEIVRYLGVPLARIEVIPPAVDTHPALGSAGAVSPAPPRAPLVLYVGTMFTRRHVPELIDAFGRLAQADPVVRLALVGADRTWPPQHVASRIAASGVSERIDWRPYVAESDLRTLYARAQAFAFLSEYEGFGLTPLEGLRSGVPPVVADVPVAHEAYGTAAFFVSPTNPSAIAAALRLALHDGPSRERVLAAAAGVLARYSWDETARRTWRVIHDTAGSPS